MGANVSHRGSVSSGTLLPLPIAPASIPGLRVLPRGSPSRRPIDATPDERERAPVRSNQWATTPARSHQPRGAGHPNVVHERERRSKFRVSGRPFAMVRCRSGDLVAGPGGGGSCAVPDERASSTNPLGRLADAVLGDRKGGTRSTSGRGARDPDQPGPALSPTSSSASSGCEGTCWEETTRVSARSRGSIAGRPAVRGREDGRRSSSSSAARPRATCPAPLETWAPRPPNDPPSRRSIPRSPPRFTPRWRIRPSRPRPASTPPPRDLP